MRKYTKKFSLFLLILFFYGCTIPSYNPEQSKKNNSIKNNTELSIDFSSYPCGVIPDKPELKTLKSIKKSSPIYNLPSSIDHSSMMPPVGDQGMQSSCVGWATGYALKTFQEGVEEEWNVNNSQFQFSPSWIYNQINHDKDKGASISDALNLITKEGCDSLARFPYDQFNFTNKPNSESFLYSSHFKALSWKYLANNINDIKNILANGEAVVFEIGVYPDFDKLNTTNQIYDNASGKLRGFHALCIVGYDETKRAFKFINSWGISGYGWITYDFINDNSPVDFQAYYLQDGTNIHNSFNFISGDYNKDGYLDIIAVKKSSTGTGSTEIHILNGATKYQSWLLQTGTILHEIDNGFNFL